MFTNTFRYLVLVAASVLTLHSVTLAVDDYPTRQGARFGYMGKYEKAIGVMPSGMYQRITDAVAMQILADTLKAPTIGPVGRQHLNDAGKTYIRLVRVATQFRTLVNQYTWDDFNNPDKTNQLDALISRAGELAQKIADDWSFVEAEMCLDQWDKWQTEVDQEDNINPVAPEDK